LAEVDSLLSEFILDDLGTDQSGTPTAPKSIKEQLTSTAPSFSSTIASYAASAPNSTMTTMAMDTPKAQSNDNEGIGTGTGIGSVDTKLI
jgi:hypothetical protein